jgi:hypothetical protein
MHAVNADQQYVFATDGIVSIALVSLTVVSLAVVSLVAVSLVVVRVHCRNSKRKNR